MNDGACANAMLFRRLDCGFAEAGHPWMLSTATEGVVGDSKHDRKCCGVLTLSLVDLHGEFVGCGMKIDGKVLWLLADYLCLLVDYLWLDVYYLGRWRSAKRRA